jgi:Arc/MetJ family transcription regulator
MTDSGSRGKAPRRVSERIVRKNMDMDARKLAAARRILGTTTDTETVDQALDLVVYQDEVIGALDRLAEAGGLAEMFPDGASEPAARRRRKTR